MVVKTVLKRTTQWRNVDGGGGGSGGGERDGIVVRGKEIAEAVERV